MGDLALALDSGSDLTRRAPRPATGRWMQATATRRWRDRASRNEPRRIMWRSSSSRSRPDRDGGASPGGGDAHRRARARCRNGDCPLCHLALFVGGNILKNEWPRIARWLSERPTREVEIARNDEMISYGFRVIDYDDDGDSRVLAKQRILTHGDGQRSIARGGVRSAVRSMSGRHRLLHETSRMGMAKTDDSDRPCHELGELRD